MLHENREKHERIPVVSRTVSCSTYLGIPTTLNFLFIYLAQILGDYNEKEEAGRAGGGRQQAS